jgi:hypothetical protein
MFFEGLKILICTFSARADGFQGHSKSFHCPIHLLTFTLLLCNYLQILKILTETLIKIPLSVIGQCSLVPTSHWLQGKYTRINLSEAASGMILS